MKPSDVGVPSEITDASLAIGRETGGSQTTTWLGMGGTVGACSVELLNKKAASSANSGVAAIASCSNLKLVDQLAKVGGGKVSVTSTPKSRSAKSV